MGHCTDNKTGMNSIYDLNDGMHWPYVQLYLLNKYYKYVSGTMLNLAHTNFRYLSRNSDKCDKEMSEAVVCERVLDDGMWPRKMSLTYYTFVVSLL